MPHPFKTTGLNIHHDIRNELFLLKDALPKPKGATKSGPSEFVPKSKSHRQYRRFCQMYDPVTKVPRERQSGCTGYSCETLLAAANVYNVDLVTGDEWYRLNQAFDKMNGRDYGPDGGATVTAAMEVGRALGLFEEYRWSYTMTTNQQAIEIAPLVAGTYWYPEMFERDAEGIVGVPSKSARLPDDGHQYVLGKYDVRRDLWWVRQTWDDGDYLIPGDLLYRLQREEGEFSQISEIKMPRGKKEVAAFRQKVADLLADWEARVA